MKHNDLRLAVPIGRRRVGVEEPTSGPGARSPRRVHRSAESRESPVRRPAGCDQEDVSVITSLLDVLLPPFCAVCGPRVDADGLPALCAACVEEVELDAGRPTCGVCAAPMHPRLAGPGRCLGCARRRPPWARLLAAGPYRGKLQTIIGLMKYGDRPSLARPLGRMLVHAIEHARPTFPMDDVDRVVPVPLTRRRSRERGFNQAELVAKEVARRFGVPLGARDLVRRDDRGPQASLSAARRRDLPGATFEPAIPVWGRRIVLVDDVVTTTSTVRVATRALLAAGAREVRVAVVARTPRR